MTRNQTLYTRWLRLFAFTAVACFSYLVVCDKSRGYTEMWGFMSMLITR